MFDQLRKIRKENKVSCAEMAAALGLKTRSAYHKKENGYVPFSLQEGKKVSDYFGLSMEAIFFSSGVSNTDTSGCTVDEVFGQAYNGMKGV